MPLCLALYAWWTRRSRRLPHAVVVTIASIDSINAPQGARAPEERASLNRAACEVLVDNLRALDRAKAFAERINEPEVWSKLAKAQLDDENVHEAVQSYIKAQDPQNYAEVIAVAQRDGAFEDLGKYLKMVRKQIKEPLVRNTLRLSCAACLCVGLCVGGWWVGP